ncbi:MAG: BamA/TamA family outer membrane protein [Elusimicrobia bacterium]|nr:BamA/TamA family outer membrane protein [Elusimicrobiota bacterium]
MGAMRAALLAAGVLVAAAAGAEGGVVAERRRPQFAGEPGYAVVPYVYNLPGIGWGYGVLGAATNVGRSQADVAGTMFLGDVHGEAVSVDQIYLIPRLLMLDAGGAHLSRATLQSFSKRGMASGKNDYSLAEFGDMYFGGARLTATFSERRYEAFVGCYAGTAELRSLRDGDGNMILSSNNSARSRATMGIFGLRADMTDDYIDPRRGLRLEPSLWRSPRRGSGPDYFLVDWSATAYLPLGRRSTWALNYFRSDAHVISRGQTDPAVLAREQGLDCSEISDAGKRARCEEYLGTLAAQNAHGTATALGGFSRMRSYPMGRFKGAHAEFFGGELRWNLTDEIRPFDIFIMKDVRTSVQVAFFYEIAGAGDGRGELWREPRSSYGSGLRIVTASGLVYRFDLAAGDEGMQPSVFFQYPWEL